MKTHEYQAKQILRISGVKVPRGILATSPLEAEDAARQLGSDVLMVKAQIHAGGRGKAGGVKVARSPTDAGNIAERILGTRLRTAQTGAEGQEVRDVLGRAGRSTQRPRRNGALSIGGKASASPRRAAARRPVPRARPAARA